MLFWFGIWIKQPYLRIISLIVGCFRTTLGVLHVIRFYIISIYVSIMATKLWVVRRREDLLSQKLKSNSQQLINITKKGSSTGVNSIYFPPIAESLLLRTNNFVIKMPDNFTKKKTYNSKTAKAWNACRCYLQSVIKCFNNVNQQSEYFNNYIIHKIVTLRLSNTFKTVIGVVWMVLHQVKSLMLFYSKYLTSIISSFTVYFVSVKLPLYAEVYWFVFFDKKHNYKKF